MRLRRFKGPYRRQKPDFGCCLSEGFAPPPPPRVALAPRCQSWCPFRHRWDRNRKVWGSSGPTQHRCSFFCVGKEPSLLGLRAAAACLSRSWVMPIHCAHHIHAKATRQSLCPQGSQRPEDRFSWPSGEKVRSVTWLPCVLCCPCWIRQQYRIEAHLVYFTLVGFARQLVRPPHRPPVEKA